jgi:hypothetical protein
MPAVALVCRRRALRPRGIFSSPVCVYPALLFACLEALELELQQGLIVERDAGVGGSAHVWDARLHAL